MQILFGRQFFLALVLLNGESLRARTMTKYPFEMTAHERTQFIAATKTLRIGDQRKRVEDVLGRPTEESILRGKRSSDIVKGVIVTYWIKKNDLNRGNEKNDEYISIVFDNEKKLVSFLTNIPGLSLPVGRDHDSSEMVEPGRLGGTDIPVGTAQAVTVTVDGQTLLAQAYRLDNGVINVGRVVVKQ